MVDVAGRFIYYTDQDCFGTLDTDAITQKYPLKIRRGFRLAIVNFIDTIAIIKAHRDELRNNTRRMSERDAIDMQMSKILATNFTHGKMFLLSFCRMLLLFIWINTFMSNLTDEREV